MVKKNWSSIRLKIQVRRVKVWIRRKWCIMGTLVSQSGLEHTCAMEHPVSCRFQYTSQTVTRLRAVPWACRCAAACLLLFSVAKVVQRDAETTEAWWLRVYLCTACVCKVSIVCVCSVSTVCKVYVCARMRVRVWGVCVHGVCVQHVRVLGVRLFQINSGLFMSLLSIYDTFSQSTTCDILWEWPINKYTFIILVIMCLTFYTDACIIASLHPNLIFPRSKLEPLHLRPERRVGEKQSCVLTQIIHCAILQIDFAIAPLTEKILV